MFLWFCRILYPNRHITRWFVLSLRIRWRTTKQNQFLVPPFVTQTHLGSLYWNIEYKEIRQPDYLSISLNRKTKKILKSINETTETTCLKLLKKVCDVKCPACHKALYPYKAKVQFQCTVPGKIAWSELYDRLEFRQIKSPISTPRIFLYVELKIFVKLNA